MSKPKRRKGDGGRYTVVKSAAAADLPNNTRQLEEFRTGGDYIAPPYDPNDLLRVVEESDILKPLIGAFATNIALFGYGVRYRKNFDFNKADQTERKAAEEEFDRLTDLYRYFSPSESFRRLLYRTVYDKETIGWGAIEILRNGAGDICGGEYARACNFRIAVQRPEDRVVSVQQKRKGADGSENTVEVSRVYRKYVQMVSGEKVYFREFGDPRQMDCKTGDYQDAVPPDRRATEILFLANHCSYSDYGVPKWAGNIPNLMGNRKSEELNLTYFLNGKMLPFAICVSGGQLTEDSLAALKEGVGVDNAFKALLLEVLPDEKADGLVLSRDGQPKTAISVEHLTDTTLSDGLFMDYQSRNREKVRGAFRLPPIYLGDSTDYNRATAEVAKLIAEEQIFIPEREDITDAFNRVVNSELGIQYCELYLRGPKIGDVSDVAAALQPFITAGTVTPNMLLDTLSELLGKEIEQALPDGIGNTPIEILKLQMQQCEAQPADIQKMAAVTTFDTMLETLRVYLGDSDG